MEKDLVDGKFLGDKGVYDLEFKGGYLTFKLVLNTGVGADLELAIKVGADALIDVIKAKIPGTIDDTVLDIVKEALKI